MHELCFGTPFNVWLFCPDWLSVFHDRMTIAMKTWEFFLSQQMVNWSNSLAKSCAFVGEMTCCLLVQWGHALLLILIGWFIRCSFHCNKDVSNELCRQTLSGPHLVLLLLFPAHLPLWVYSLLLHRLVIEAGQP